MVYLFISFNLHLFVQTDGRMFAEASYLINNNLKCTACIEDGRQEPGKPLHSFGKLGESTSILCKNYSRVKINLHMSSNLSNYKLEFMHF
jgi:hypothetical protein